MDIAVQSGLVQAGQYEVIRAAGDVKFAHGVRFLLLKLQGSLRAPELVGKSMQCDGDVLCDGDLCVDNVHGHGSLQVAGNGWCDAVTFTGLFDIAGILRCQTHLEVNGKLISERLISADTARLNGVLQGKELHARDLQLRPLEAPLLERLSLRRYTGTSTATVVQGESVEVHRLNCRSISAASVYLGPECKVDQITFEKDLGIASTAQVQVVRDRRIRHAQD